MTDQTDQSLDPNSETLLPSEGSLSYLVLICFVATLGGLLFGYDTAVIAGAIDFLKQYFGLTPAQEGWAASSALVGCIIGTVAAGVMNDFWGRRKVLIVCAVLFIISAVGSAMPESEWVFVVFRILGGIGVGAASMTSPLYIAEISPAHIRGRMVSLNQLAIVFGMLAVYFVNYAIALSGDEAWNTETGWRWMFASETIPAVLLLLLLLLVPESPRWLVAKARSDEALAILSRVSGRKSASQEVALIKETIQQEGDRLHLILTRGMGVAIAIGIALAVLQQVTGINVFLYYAPKIFKSLAGSQVDVAMLQTVVVGAVNMSFTIIAIWSVDRLGRKPLMILGYTGMAISLAALGAATYFDRTEGWVLAFILSYIACFALSVGPVTWVILSEIYPTKIRGLAMSIATIFLWAANFVVSQTFPMMNENHWLVATFHHAFPFLVYAALSLLAVFFIVLFVPETKGRTLEEIERHWSDR